MFSLLRDIYRSEPRWFVRMVLLSVLVSLSGGVSVLLLVPLLQCFDIQSGSRWAVLNRFLPDVSGNVQLACILGVFVLAMVCKALLNRHVQLLHARLTQDYMTKLRLRLYKAVSQADWQHLIRFRRSDLLNLFHADCTRISNAAIQLVQGISLLMTAAVQIAIALVMNVPLTLFVLVSGGGFFLAFRPMMRRSKQCGQSIRSSALTFFAEIDDQISGMKEIPVITGYTLDGKPVTAFDPTDDLDRMEPVVTMLPGWNCDISHCTLYNELPDEAKGYIEFLEKQLVHVIQFVSTGAEREQYLLKGTWL